jgi:hypothetical protein
MNILDYVIPKKGWGYLMPQPGAGEEEEPQAEDSDLPEPAIAEAEDPVPASARTVPPPLMEVSLPPQREEEAESPSFPQKRESSPAPTPGATAPALASPPARTDSYSRDGPLEAGLRDLFTEASVMDPQLVSLLRRIGHVGADDLAAELKDFSRAIGAEGAGSEGRTPG